MTKPRRGLEINNNSTSIDILKQRETPNPQELLACKLGSISTRYYVESDDTFYTPVLALTRKKKY